MLRRYYDPRPTVCRGIKECCDMYVCTSVCLSHAAGSITVYFRAMDTARHIGDLVLEVEATGQRDWPYDRRIGGRNDIETVASVASEAFATWLHHRYAPIELPSAVWACRFAARYSVTSICLHPTECSLTKS